MLVGDFPTVFSAIMKCWLNRMVTSENGIIHTYMRCIYVHLQSCTCISDVSKRGVLGSADDDIAFFLHIVTFLLIMGRSIIFHWFSLFWRYVSLFFIIVSNYMVQSKVIMSLWWKDMDLKKKRVPREKSGRHSNLIYLVLKPLLKNPGRHSVIFSISKMFFIIVQCFFILKMVFIDFSLFWRCCSLLFNDFSLFSRCF